MKNISKKTKEKASLLLKEGKVIKEVETDKRIHFKVISKETHSVIFDKEKNTWECDCKWGSLREKHCSHILACNLFLERTK